MTVKYDYEFFPGASSVETLIKSINGIALEEKNWLPLCRSPVYGKFGVKEIDMDRGIIVYATEKVFYHGPKNKDFEFVTKVIKDERTESQKAEAARRQSI